MQLPQLTPVIHSTEGEIAYRAFHSSRRCSRLPTGRVHTAHATSNRWVNNLPMRQLHPLQSAASDSARRYRRLHCIPRIPWLPPVNEATEGQIAPRTFHSDRPVSKLTTVKSDVAHSAATDGATGNQRLNCIPHFSRHSTVRRATDV